MEIVHATPQNPCKNKGSRELANYEEFASAAAQAGISYENLIQRILNLGLRR